MKISKKSGQASVLKSFLLTTTVFGISIVLLLHGVYTVRLKAMPPYINSIGDRNYTEKITGMYLLEQSAKQKDNLIVFGSSELRTTEVSTHPANFFAGKRAGFQVNLVGRGSCQSLIHAISIAASGNALSGKKVVIITSPQSFVPEGISPDMFLANFSEQQYLELLADDDLSAEVKQYISTRVAELYKGYKETESAIVPNLAIEYLAESYVTSSSASSARDIFLSPYYSLNRYLFNLKDMTESSKLIHSQIPAPVSKKSATIDWVAERQTALFDAISMTDNNDFGMLNDYYTTYIGTRLSRQENQDSDLDYSVSKEYDDLRILFEICKQKDIEPLFVHVPLHGQWSDYIGFSLEHRQAYYENVRNITDEYGILLLDLTKNEYEPYYLCDVMHLGWKGWLDIDKALVEYYYSV